MSEPTYRDVAEWLPTDIREAIEATLPCRVYGEHDWRHMRTEFHKWGRLEPAVVIEHWSCPCGLAHTTNPETRA